jgi:hypothetical protein
VLARSDSSDFRCRTGHSTSISPTTFRCLAADHGRDAPLARSPGADRARRLGGRHDGPFAPRNCQHSGAAGSVCRPSTSHDERCPWARTVVTEPGRRHSMSVDSMAGAMTIRRTEDVSRF